MCGCEAGVGLNQISQVELYKTRDGLILVPIPIPELCVSANTDSCLDTRRPFFSNITLWNSLASAHCDLNECN